MKNKILTLLVITAVLLSVFTLCTSAFTSDESFAEWEISDDGKELIRYEDDEETVYRRLNIGQNRYSLDNKIYYFASNISFDGFYFSIAASSHDSNTVYLENAYNGELTAYVRDGGDDLISFVTGEYEVARIFYRDSAVLTDNEFISKLDDMSESKLTSAVSELRDVEMLEVYTYDSEDILSHLHGAIYLIDDVPYYVNYDALGNNYFDSNGYFSYNKGEVDLFPITGNVLTEYEQLLEEMEYYSIEINYEDEYDDFFEEEIIFELDEASAMVLLIVVIVIFGIAIPTAPFIISLINLFKKKAKHVFVTYVTFVAAAIWLVLGITMLVLIIII